MREGAISFTARGRAASFAAAACVVALACALLIVVSRVQRLGDDRARRGVEVLLEERPSVPPSARSRTGAPRVNSTDAPPTRTPLPAGRDMLARALACFDTLREAPRADCPSEHAQSEPGAAFGYAPAPRRSRHVFSRGEEMALFAGVEPPCAPGLTYGNFSVRYCARVTPKPPPPSRSAEEICEQGGLGPCRPPAFRAEDLVRLAHTE